MLYIMHSALRKGPLFYKNASHFPLFNKKSPPFDFRSTGLLATLQSSYYASLRWQILPTVAYTFSSSGLTPRIPRTVYRYF